MLKRKNSDGWHDDCFREARGGDESERELRKEERK
jgi:hypothetical protein